MMGDEDELSGDRGSPGAGGETSSNSAPPAPEAKPAPEAQDSQTAAKVDAAGFDAAEYQPAEAEVEPASLPDNEQPPPKPKQRPRARMETSPQTPIARSSSEPPSSGDAARPVPSSALKPPRAPSFGSPPVSLNAPVHDEIEVELDLSPEALNTEARAPIAEPPSAPPPASQAPLRPLTARPISAPSRPAPPSPKPASEPPRPVQDPYRGSKELPTSDPPRPISDPPRRVSDRPQRVMPPVPDRISEPPLSEPPPIPVIDAALEPLSPQTTPSSADGSVADGPVADGSVADGPAPVAAPPRPGRVITIPDDQVPQGKSEDASEASRAISAMRIISVGEPTDDDIPLEVMMEPFGEAEAEEPAARAKLDSAEELSDEDVAPDSDESDEAGSNGAARMEHVSSERVPSGKPPPPPRRPMPPPRDRQPTLIGIESERKRRPWWEEVFGEDYVRAAGRLSDTQITHEVDFIEESLGVAPGGVVLDLGCGAGYHAVELARRGYGVVGYDLSLYQLALAADVAQDRGQKLNFLQGDMREMAFEEMFDAVYCWNTTFGYFEEEKNILVAQRIFRALRPGGMFLLDVANRDFAAVQQPSQVWYEGDACVCMDDMSVDFITSRLRVKRNIILDDGRTRECTYSVRLYSLHELGKILHDVGFRVAEASGHPATPGVFFGDCSPRIIMLAQKP